MVSRLRGEWHHPPLQNQAGKDHRAEAKQPGSSLVVGVLKAHQKADPTKAKPRPT